MDLFEYRYTLAAGPLKNRLYLFFLT